MIAEAGFWYFLAKIDGLAFIPYPPKVATRPKTGRQGGKKTPIGKIVENRVKLVLTDSITFGGFGAWCLISGFSDTVNSRTKWSSYGFSTTVGESVATCSAIDGQNGEKQGKSGKTCAHPGDHPPLFDMSAFFFICVNP